MLLFTFLEAFEDMLGCNSCQGKEDGLQAEGMGLGFGVLGFGFRV